MIESSEIVINRRVRAIVQFGPATPTSGMRGGEYFQCVIDPNMVSPSGRFIRFDQRMQGGELHGWQRVEAMTIGEVLGEEGDYPPEKILPGYAVVEGASVTMRGIV